MSDNILERVRTAIAEVFGNYISEDPAQRRKIIEEATFLGHDDPGQWSPKAAVVIHCESGIPNSEHWRLIDAWEQVSNKLKTHFCEPVNCGVIGVYRV